MTIAILLDFLKYPRNSNAPIITIDMEIVPRMGEYIHEDIISDAITDEDLQSQFDEIASYKAFTVDSIYWLKRDGKIIPQLGLQLE